MNNEKRNKREKQKKKELNIRRSEVRKIREPKYILKTDSDSNQIKVKNPNWGKCE